MTARLFARLRELAGTGSEPVEGAATVGDVYAVLRRRHPSLPEGRALLRAARNEQLAQWSDAVRDGDEVAFIPPVSGGAGGEPPGMLFSVGSQELDARALEAAVAHPGAGAICTFTGIVRDNSRGEPTTHLQYESYEGMAVRAMAGIATELAERWPEIRVAMAHRTGRLEIGQPSVVVSVSAPHRAAAIEACWRGIDRLKESVPIWKKEFARSGAYWIEGPTAEPAPAPGDAL
ncbi:MAG: molybdenum cofactor biosynthesis protein [Candidatus Dormibacteraceae bacterium]